MTTKKILFACAPFDGHFSPLTSLAMHLKSQGHQVRWYTQSFYTKKLQGLGIPHYPFVRADQINQENLDALFPERKKINNAIKKINFDIRSVFVKQGPLYYRDIQKINTEFEFDLLIADSGFTGIPYVKELMRKPVFAVGVFPLNETSRDLAPSGLGLTPAKTALGRRKQAFLRFFAQKVLFGATNKLSHKLLKEYGIISKNFLFDEMSKRSTLMLQSGSPGFEYHRSDLSSNVRFIGPLLPYFRNQQRPFRLETYKKYDKVVLVTQGTVEKDVSKLLVPALEAFRNTNTLVIATTGGSSTEDLKRRYRGENFIIEDFIPFSDVLPLCDVFITNGGYGGVMLGIQNRVPMVVAGVHEGKNEICARVGYFKLGINLKTESPAPDQIRQAVDSVTADKTYRDRVVDLAQEFSQYNPNALLDQFMGELFGRTQRFSKEELAVFA